MIMKTTMNVVEPLPRIWRAIFWVEIPLTLGAVIFWLFSPDVFLAQLLGENSAANQHAKPLLYSYAGVVFSLVLWMYTRLLLQKEVHIYSFCLFQEALLVGDIWIVINTLLNLPDAPVPLHNATLAMALATFWGGVRSIYLAQQFKR